MLNRYILKIIVTGLIFSIIIISGCTTLPTNYEDETLSFNVPPHWRVNEEQISDELAKLQPVDAIYPVIYIHQSNLKPRDIIDGYITNYPYEYPRFKVVTREYVKVNGFEGEKLIYKNSAQDDFLLIGPDFFSVVVAFGKSNQTYVISTTEAMEHTYYSRVEPALEVLLNSIKVKE